MLSECLASLNLLLCCCYDLALATCIVTAQWWCCCSGAEPPRNLGNAAELNEKEQLLGTVRPLCGAVLTRHLP